VKKFIKKNIYLITILLISVVLRFLFLDKADGLGYDELIGSFKEAHQPNIAAVIAYTLKMDIHLPLYQILLHCWAKLFSFADYSLRSFSAVCGVLTVLVSYFVGKELKSEQTGLVCALIFSINSFLIYYSQEVRMYCLMALLSSIFLLFLVKIKNDYKNKWNHIGFVIFAFAVISTHTLSAFFVFPQIALLIIYMLVTDKENKTDILKRFLISGGALIALCLPFLIFILIHSHKYTNFYGGFYFDASSLLVIMQNWFTPVLAQSNLPHYVGLILSTFNISTLIFIFIPIVLAIYSIVYSVKKDKFSLVFLGGILFFLASELIAVKFTNFKLIARYTMVIVPSLLILVGYGFSLMMEKKYLKNALLFIFLAVNIFYLAFSGNSAFRLQRGGLKPLAQILNANQIKDGDFVVVWNNREVLEKYVDKKLNIFGILGNIAYTSEVILNNQAELNKMSIEQRKTALRNYFASADIPANNIYLIDSINDHMLKGQKFIITTNDYFDSFSRKSFTELVNNDKNYKEISYNNLLTIKALIDIKKLSYEKFRFIKRIEDKHIVIMIFEK